MRPFANWNLKIDHSCDATSQALGVNPHTGVEYSHMTDPVMQKDSSQEKISSSSTDSIRPKDSRTSLILYTVVAVGLALFIRFFIAAPYIVQGASMEPTFFDYHYLIVDRLSYRISEPVRGDVVVFNLPQNESRALIKRIIGLPHETVVIEGGVVTIKNAAHPDGFTLDEPYLDSERMGGISALNMALGEDEYFVLGDNRHVSADSRTWGPLPEYEIVGRVFVRLYPFTHISVFPGVSRYQE